MNFSDQVWNSIVSDMSRVFHFNAEQKNRLFHEPLAKLVGFAPFYTGAREPLRNAYHMLSTFLTDIILSNGSPFDAKPEDKDDLDRRLEYLLHFPGGDPDRIKNIERYYLLTMLYDYKHDKGEDLHAGKYNPANDGLDVDKKILELISEIEHNADNEITNIITVNDASRGWWEN
jgi:hypothetical protein